MRIAVAGATGRTGREVVDEAGDRGHEVVALSRTPTDGQRDVADLPVVLGADTDALVDFTVPRATVEHARATAEAGTPLVVGTTGFNEQGVTALREAAETVPVLKAANFAKGVQVLRRVVREAVEALPAYDVEVTETHHAGKRDAPSGTAKTLLDDVDAARRDDADADREGDADAAREDDSDREDELERVHGREGTHERDPAEVGVHVRRAGTVRGEHEVLLAGDDEVLTLAHRAESRRVFAAGALDAAEWLVGHPPGYYDFAEVVA